MNITPKIQTILDNGVQKHISGEVWEVTEEVDTDPMSETYEQALWVIQTKQGDIEIMTASGNDVRAAITTYLEEHYAGDTIIQ